MFYFETTSEDEKRSYTELLQRKSFDALSMRQLEAHGARAGYFVVSATAGISDLTISIGGHIELNSPQTGNGVGDFVTTVR